MKMKILLCFLCFLLTKFVCLKAEDIPIILTLEEVSRDYRDDRSILIVPTASHEGRSIYSGYDSSGFLGFKKEGHAWVCDGTSQWDSGTEYAIHILERAYSEAEPIRMSFIYSRKVGRIYNAFYHMNWGWGGLCDGGYFYDEVNVKFDDGTNLNFAHGREDIISIAPPSN